MARATIAGPGAAQQVRMLQEALDARESELAGLRDDPLLTATVVEIRLDDVADRMIISLGPGNAIDVNALEGVKIGDRVRCHRNTMQAIDVIRDEIPTGTIVTAMRQTGNLVEAEVMGSLRAFRAAPGMTVAKGERVIVDTSLTFVIGTLGMPPQTFSFAPKVAVSWEDVGGHAEAKAALREAIELPYSHPHLFAAYGKRPVRGVLLHGPSGTGKTLIAKAAATAIARAHGHAHADGFVYVKGPELLNSFIGKSEEAIRRLFAAARTHHAQHGYPAVIFLDECDALLGQRDRGANTNINATTVPQFLAEMDGLDDQATMLILATNRPDMLDPAVTREGRIDRRVRVGRPTREDALAILGIHLKGRPHDIAGLELIVDEIYSDARVVKVFEAGLAHAELALRLRNFVSGAMIAGVVELASTAAMMRDIHASATSAGGMTAADLIWALDRTQGALAHANHAEAMQEMMEVRVP